MTCLHEPFTTVFCENLKKSAITSTAGSEGRLVQLLTLCVPTAVPITNYLEV